MDRSLCGEGNVEEGSREQNEVEEEEEEGRGKVRVKDWDDMAHC
jgi:hypothetical protein